MYNGSPEKKQSFTQGYTKYYVDSLVPVMIESGIDISRNFMDTSPSNGFSMVNGSYTKLTDLGTTANDERGDRHFYYLMGDCEDDKTHTFNRFLSESGIQSEPSFMDYKQISLPEDWS